MREAIAAELPDIIAALVVAAKCGDAQAARLLIERVLPTMRPEESPLNLSLPTGGAAAQAVALIEGAAAGQIAPGQAAALVGALAAVAKIRESDELFDRIEKLEKLHAAR